MMDIMDTLSRRALVLSVLAALVGIGLLAGCGSSSGGNDLVMRLGADPSPATLNAEMSIIRDRLRLIGDGSTVSADGSRGIVVRLDKAAKRDLVLQTVTQTGHLGFRAVLGLVPPPCPRVAALTPTDEAVLPEEGSSGHAACYRVGPQRLDGSIVAAADPNPPTVGGDWSIEVRFTPDGSVRFDALAAELINRQLAIELDGIIKSAPTIQQAVFQGTASITGAFDEAAARALAAVLHTKPLPDPIIEVTCRAAACGSQITLPSPSASATTMQPLATAPTTAAPPTAARPATAVPIMTAPTGTGCPNLDGSSPHFTKFSSTPPNCIDPNRTYEAIVTTDVGAFTVLLNAKLATKTVNNFVFLAGYHFYDGIVFHRVVPGFVVQGGDPTGSGSGGPGYSFADELPPAGSYQIGSLAMANAGPNTNGSQCFIVTGAAGVQLPPNYSLFGQVSNGLDVLQHIDRDGAPDPNPPVILHQMLRVTISSR
jgi:cyclophilin family peptidyl-prolyl cis-trans isomerase